MYIPKEIILAIIKPVKDSYNSEVGYMWSTGELYNEALSLLEDHNVRNFVEAECSYEETDDIEEDPCTGEYIDLRQCFLRGKGTINGYAYTISVAVSCNGYENHGEWLSWDFEAIPEA